MDSPQEFLALQKACIAQVERYVLMAEKKLGISMPMPQIRFCIKGGVAGRAYLQKNLITFNPKLIRLNPQEFLERTPGHEVAHLVDFVKHGFSSHHGDNWRRVMWAFNLPAIRCHNYQMEEGQKKRVVVQVEEDKIIRPIHGGKIIEFD